MSPCGEADTRRPLLALLVSTLTNFQDDIENIFSAFMSVEVPKIVALDL